MAVDAAELLTLLRQLRRSSSVRGRARILRRAAAVVRDLSPAARRQLAIDVAAVAAPGLLPRIRAESGLDLTDEQVAAVLQMLRSLDDDDIDALTDRLVTTEPPSPPPPDPDVVFIEDEASPELPPEPTLNVPEDEASPEPPPEPNLDVPDDLAPPEPPPEPIVDVADDLAAPGPPPEQISDIGDDLAAPEPPPEPQVHVADDVVAPPSPEPELGLPDLAAWRPAPIPPERFRFGAPAARPDAGGTAVPAADPDGVPHERSWFGGGDLGIAEVASPRPTLVDELTAIARPAERLRRLRRSLAAVARAEPVEMIAVVRAIPEGWTRRRAVDALVEHGIALDALRGLVGTLRSRVDRAWVVATALAHAKVTIAALDAGGWLDRHVGSAAAARLRRRYG